MKYRIVKKENSNFEYRVQSSFLYFFWSFEVSYTPWPFRNNVDKDRPYEFSSILDAFDFIDKCKKERNQIPVKKDKWVVIRTC